MSKIRTLSGEPQPTGNSNDSFKGPSRRIGDSENGSDRDKTDNTDSSSSMEKTSKRINLVDQRKPNGRPENLIICTVFLFGVFFCFLFAQTENFWKVQRSDCDKPLAGNAANQPNAQFDDGDAKRNDEGITKPPTGNINKGPGAGAINRGTNAGSIIGQRSDRDKPLAGNAANQPNAQFNDGDAKRNDEGITKLPTGNINKGPGAGAINRGERAGSIIGHKSEINFKLSKDDSEVSVPSNGNINRGPGAGGDNCGTESASIINSEGPINF